MPTLDEYTCTECGHRGTFERGPDWINCETCGRLLYLVPVRTNDWHTPLPFGDSYWIKKESVEPLVKAVRRLLDNIYEFDKPTDSIIVELVEQAWRDLTLLKYNKIGYSQDGEG